MADAPAEPSLNQEERDAFARGVQEFNSGHFFECHDTLEDVWNGVRGPSRDFFQGLIQVAVGFYHLSGGNLAGAESMFGRALKRLAKYPERYFGFDLGQQRNAIGGWLTRVRAGDVAPDALPKWHFDWMG